MQDWTEEQKQTLIKKYPHVKMFWMPFSPNLPYGAERLPADKLALLNDMRSFVEYDEEKMERRDAAIRRKVSGESLSEEDIRLLKEIGQI